MPDGEKVPRKNYKDIYLNPNQDLVKKNAAVSPIMKQTSADLTAKMSPDGINESVTNVSESEAILPINAPPEKPTAYAWFVLFMIFVCRALH